MIKVLRDWMQRYFSDEEAVVLAIMLVLGFSVILAFGGMLAPVLAAMVAVRVVVATAQGRAVVPVAGRVCKAAVRTIAARS